MRPLHSRGLFLCDEFTQASVVSDQYDIDLLSYLHRVNAYQLSQNSTTLSCAANRNGRWLVSNYMKYDTWPAYANCGANATAVITVAKSDIAVKYVFMIV